MAFALFAVAVRLRLHICLAVKAISDLASQATCWVVAVLLCALALSLTIPVKLKSRLEETVPFFNLWLFVAFGVLVWLGSSLAANELNEVFKVSANLLPKALIALTFVFVVTGAGIVLGGLAIFFQGLMIVAAFTLDSKKSHQFFVSLSFSVISFAAAYLGFLIAVNPALSGTARSYAVLIALEFDFDDQVLCKSFESGHKYLFLNEARDQILSVVPMSYQVTKKEIISAKESGKEIKFFNTQTVQRCFYQ